MKNRAFQARSLVLKLVPQSRALILLENLPNGWYFDRGQVIDFPFFDLIRQWLKPHALTRAEALNYFQSAVTEGQYYCAGQIHYKA